MPSPRPPLPSPADFRVHCDLEVRFRDLDAMGHVNNAVYFTYLEVARTEYMRALGYLRAGAPASELDFPFILAEISCRYLAAALLGQPLRVYLRTRRIGGKSFDFEYLLVERGSDQPLAVATSVQVYYDYAAGRTLPVPPEFRQQLERLEGRSL